MRQWAVERKVAVEEMLISQRRRVRVAVIATRGKILARGDVCHAPPGGD